MNELNQDENRENFIRRFVTGAPLDTVALLEDPLLESITMSFFLRCLPDRGGWWDQTQDFRHWMMKLYISMEEERANLHKLVWSGPGESYGRKGN